jgi:hypothetical protein
MEGSPQLTTPNNDEYENSSDTEVDIEVDITSDIPVGTKINFESNDTWALSRAQRIQKDGSILLPRRITTDALKVYEFLVFDQRPAQGREPRWHALYGVWVTESGHVYDPNPLHHSDPDNGPLLPLPTFVTRRAPMVSLSGRTYLPRVDVEHSSTHRRSVAQLVLETWDKVCPGNPNSYSAYHLDDDNTNAHVDNLMWRNKRETQYAKKKTYDQRIESEITSLYAMHREDIARIMSELSVIQKILNLDPQYPMPLDEEE